MIHETCSVETEARYFLSAWKNGEDIEKLRADIRPGVRSDAVSRELRLKVLYRFERLVEAAGTMGVRA